MTKFNSIMSWLTPWLMTLLTVCSVSAQSAAPATSKPAPASAASTANTTNFTQSAPDVAARAWVLYDMTSQQVLAAKDIDTSVEPASLTKLMTAYLVFEALKTKRISPEQKVNVSTLAWKQEGSRMFVEPRMPVAVDDLLKGMIVQSGNDATVALAETVAGSVERFVDNMNRQAQVLGLKGTSFKNVTGLTAPGHVTTLRDLITLSERLIRDFPEFFSLYSLKQYTYNSITQTNRNLLLFRDASVDGLKTGHTDSAGYCLVVTARKPLPPAVAGSTGVSDRRLISIVVGTANDEARARESQKLLNWAFANFDAVRLFDSNQAAETPRVWKGTINNVRLGSAAPMFVTLPKGDAAKLKTTIVRADPLMAPIEKGAPIATLRVSIDQQVIAERPLVALDAVPQASIIGRAWDQLRLWVK
jgi:D-alanyl-D-alanine carboxypeptidase (penicillin-binding protein 5/6)